MLVEFTASGPLVRFRWLPRHLFEANGLDDFINDLQRDLALHSEADDIAAYIIGAPGISYSEALVTLASDAYMSKPAGHSVLVPLRVLRIFSSLDPTELKEYGLTFERFHLDDVSYFIEFCMKHSTPPRAFFTSGERTSWKMIRDTCSRLRTCIAQIDFFDWSNFLRGGADYIAPQRFDVVRKLEVKYRRGRELMHATVRDANVYLKAQPLSAAATELLSKYSIKLGPLREFGVSRAVNENGGDDDNGMLGLNELIDDVNNGIRAPTRWLFSHVFCGRISGSDEDGSKTSWFPERSPDAQYVYVPLALRRIIDNAGQLLRSSQGSIALPMLGCGKVGTLSILPPKSGQMSQVQTEWRNHLPDENFERATDHGWEVTQIELF